MSDYKAELDEALRSLSLVVVYRFGKARCAMGEGADRYAVERRIRDLFARVQRERDDAKARLRIERMIRPTLAEVREIAYECVLAGQGHQRECSACRDRADAILREHGYGGEP